MGFSITRSRLALIAGLVAIVVAAATVLAPVTAAQSGTRERLADFTAAFGGGVEIGVSVRDITDADVTRENLAGPSGAYVQSVRADSPAGEAGLAAGDIILTFDSERVRSARQLVRLVEETPEGREVQVTVRRAGESLTVALAPEASSGWFTHSGVRVNPEIIQRFSVPPTPSVPFVAPGPARLGVSVQPVTDQLGEYFGAPGGLLVTSVNPGTPAEAAGLRAGDVITEVGGATVSSVADLRRRLADASGETTLTIVRDRAEQTLTVSFDDDRPTAVTTI